MQRKITKSYSLFVAESFWNAEKGYADKTNKRQIGCIKSADGNGECIFNERFLKERPEFLKWRFFRVGKGKYEFERRNADEIIRILENGTGVVYLGFPECKWCQKYVTYLNEAAKENDITRIYYFDILDARSKNTSEYQQIVSLLEEYLEYDEEGNKRVFVPAVIVVDKGEIVGFDDETSLDTHNLDDPEEYWTEEEVNDLMSRLATMFDYVNDGTCNECNE